MGKVEPNPDGKGGAKSIKERLNKTREKGGAKILLHLLTFQTPIIYKPFYK
jgi:hypothetical protein